MLPTFSLQWRDVRKSSSIRALWGPWGCGKAGLHPEVVQGGCENFGARQQKPQFLGSVPSSPAALLR